MTGKKRRPRMTRQMTREMARVRAISMLSVRLPTLSIEALRALDEGELSTLFKLHEAHFRSPL